ncbi:MAG: aspartyl-tRNA(Asn)/glutamyl-tRNA (Gln) amidotransferase subunit C [Rhodospirillaceae bacterium]|nr:MAG: aspartyl-tRNA(Asn)/glutamyl-tRNA (Gln) amidotransferase subunit C [Rhodospirillaceae bacterium]
MLLDKATVRTIAFLARIDTPEEELAPLAGELSSILHWIEQLQTVDTTGIAPMTSATAMHLSWRDDDITDGACADSVLANAPDSAEGFFLVPKVVE